MRAEGREAKGDEEEDEEEKEREEEGEKAEAEKGGGSGGHGRKLCRKALPDAGGAFELAAVAAVGGESQRQQPTATARRTLRISSRTMSWSESL